MAQLPLLRSNRLRILMYYLVLLERTTVSFAARNTIAGRCHGSEEVAQVNVQWANRVDGLWNVRNSEDCGVHEYCLPMTYRLSF